MSNYFNYLAVKYHIQYLNEISLSCIIIIKTWKILWQISQSWIDFKPLLFLVNVQVQGQKRKSDATDDDDPQDIFKCPM